MAVEWRQDNQRMAFGLGKGVDEVPPFPERRASDIRKVPRVSPGLLSMIWGATAFLVILAVLFLSMTAANQARTSGDIVRTVGELQKQVVVLNKLAIDLTSRVEALERAPKVVPTTSIKPETSVPVLDSGGRQLPALDPITRKEVVELRAAVNAQGEKLDAVLDGLRNAEGSRRRRR